MKYVDLVTAHPEDILSQTIVDSVVGQLEKKLSSIACPYHNQYPQIVLAGTVTDLKIEILGCCQPFVDSAWQIIATSNTK
jgi:hypothetical protein